ncbi:MAG: hypothetical protein AAFQ40_15305 [Cyanobacteria bacterium J06623_5]
MRAPIGWTLVAIAPFTTTFYRFSSPDDMLESASILNWLIPDSR